MFRPRPALDRMILEHPGLAGDPAVHRQLQAHLDRLDAFLKLADDPKLRPDEKLAVALSGWVVGSDNAVTVLDQALRFWQAHFLVLDYLRTSADADPERKTILGKLEVLEGVGPERVAQMIPLLPATFDQAGAVPGKMVRIEVPGSKPGAAAAYGRRCSTCTASIAPNLPRITTSAATSSPCSR